MKKPSSDERAFILLSFWLQKSDLESILPKKRLRPGGAEPSPRHWTLIAAGARKLRGREISLI
jgi:hypothetical protein